MTTVHLDDGQLQHVLHEAVAPADRSTVMSHLESCDSCRGKLEAARQNDRTIESSLSRLDHPVPRVSFDQVVAATRPRRAATRRWRWAAGIVVALGAGSVAYAAPGSPLPALVRRVASWVNRPAARTEVIALPFAAAAAGVMLDPSATSVIDIAQVQPGDTLVVTVGSGQSIAVRARGGAVAFKSDVDRLTITNAGSAAQYEIEIPQSATRVEIRAGGRVVVSRSDAREMTPPIPPGGRLVVTLGRAR